MKKKLPMKPMMLKEHAAMHGNGAKKAKMGKPKKVVC